MNTMIHRQMKWVTDLAWNIEDEQGRFIAGKAFNALMVKLKMHTLYPADLELAAWLAHQNGFVLVSWNVVLDRSDLCLVVTMFLDDTKEAKSEQGD